VLTLLSESPSSTLHAPGRVGGLAPLATTSAGRVLVSDLADDELAALGLGEAADAIAQARNDGYAIVREEFEPGLVAAAVPIRDAGGRVIAALNVSAPRFRFDDRLEAASLLLVEVAAELSAELRGSLQPA
jgi:IclR family transcriptional regulator, KDG regulon repressor